MKPLLTLLLGLPLLLGALPLRAQPGKPNTGLPVIRLAIGGHALEAEVASNDAQRQTGLMHRFSLPPDRGMLFVFDAPRPLSFWMRNTYVPLSIAYIDAQGRILNIEELVPQDERSKWSAGPALYALEMRKGWFAQKGIRPGAKVDGLPPASKE
ncbi:MAG: hypothetical protein BroJett026_36190 [Betaproteobacteria bacterium]|nr:MAG: hypothetical protein BroJett026_36190 [Betaproteobacteria bacterium]